MKHYDHGRIKAVNGIDLQIRKGEIFAFIGANGSGKTTTIECLVGVLKPTSGNIKIWGLEQPTFRRKLTHYFGLAPQEYSLYLDLTVWENITFFGQLYGIGKDQMLKNAEEIIDVLNLRDKKDEVAETLSGGMKRRLSIACALIHQPPVLILDEATVGVDPVLRAYFWDYFRNLTKGGKKTILITSHVMDEAERADRIGLMRQGKLIEVGTPAELKAKYNVNTIEEVFIQLSGDVIADE